MGNVEIRNHKDGHLPKSVLGKEKRQKLQEVTHVIRQVSLVPTFRNRKPTHEHCATSLNPKSKVDLGRTGCPTTLSSRMVQCCLSAKKWLLLSCVDRLIPVVLRMKPTFTKEERRVHKQVRRQKNFDFFSMGHLESICRRVVSNLAHKFSFLNFARFLNLGVISF